MKVTQVRDQLVSFLMIVNNNNTETISNLNGDHQSEFQILNDFSVDKITSVNNFHSDVTFLHTKTNLQSNI